MATSYIGNLLSTMVARGAVTVGAKTCFDEGGKWRRAYFLTDADLDQIACSLFPDHGSTEIWFQDKDGNYLDEPEW